MGQHVGGDAKRHQRRETRSQLVELRCRPAMRWPADATRVVTTAGAAKPREPHRHRAEQRRDRMVLPVFDVASSVARRTLRTQNCRRGRSPAVMISCCTRTRSCFASESVKPSSRNLANVAASAELHDVNAPSRTRCSRLDEPLEPPHPRCRPRSTDPGSHIAFVATPQDFWTLPKVGPVCKLNSPTFPSATVAALRRNDSPCSNRQDSIWIPSCLGFGTGDSHHIDGLLSRNLQSSQAGARQPPGGQREYASTNCYRYDQGIVMKCR